MKTIYYYLKNQLDLSFLFLFIICLIMFIYNFTTNDFNIKYILGILCILLIRLILLSTINYYNNIFWIKNKSYNLVKPIYEDNKNKLISHKKSNYSMNIIYIILLTIVSILFIISIFNNHSNINALLIALSIIITAQPKHLDILINTIIISAIKKLSKKNIILNTNITTLDNCKNMNYLFISKDSVLVKDKIRVVKIYDHISEITSTNIEKMQLINTLLAMCNSFEDNNDLDNNSHKNILDLTLLNYAKDYNVHKNMVLGEMEKISVIPFSSDRKLMTTIHKLDDTHFLTITKGCIESIIEKSVYILDKYDNTTFLASDKSKASIIHGKMAGKGLSVIGVAYRHWDFEPNVDNFEEIEENLIFVGMAGINYYMKDNINKYINNCYDIGIKPILVTGEHSITSKYIANKTGIIKSNKEEALSGDELDKLDQNQLMSKVESIKIFSRLSDKHKYLIYKIFSNKGNVVGYIGNENMEFIENGLMFYNNKVEIGKMKKIENIKVNGLKDVLEVVKTSKCLENHIKITSNIWKLCLFSEIFLWIVVLIFCETNILLSFQILLINLIIYAMLCISK